MSFVRMRVLQHQSHFGVDPSPGGYFLATSTVQMCLALFQVLGDQILLHRGVEHRPREC